MRGKRTLTATVAAVLGTALAACSGEAASGDYPNLSGTQLEVVGAWSGTEQARFTDVLNDFTVRTGASVAYISAHGRVPEVVDGRLAARTPPDVALLPQPGLLRRYAAAGRLVALDAETARLVQQNYAPIWRSLGSASGRLYGVWFKAANKSLLWYDVSAFERAGLAPPEELAGLRGVARDLRATGVAPFSVGGKDQWTLTDWFENIYLQQAGPQAYDRLAAHRIRWTDPTVTAALRTMAELLAPRNLLGGVRGTQHTGFEDSVALAFVRPPAAAMVMEGDFVASVLATRTDAQIGVTVDAAAFPAAHAAVPLVVGGGDVAVQLRPSRAGAELMRYLASPEAAAVWARSGGFISPNQELDLAVYPDALTRSIARSMVEAGDGFRFDLSDLQPAAFGSTPGAGMQQALSDFLNTRDVPATARRLERAANAAYAEASR